MRVLVIEDDPRIRGFLARGLADESHEVEEVTDGAAGLESAARQQHDLILLDLALPSMDGYEVLRKLRTYGVRTPVIVLSARDMTSDKVKLLDVGADDYLTKPFSYSELSARIRALVRRSRDGDVAPLRVGNLSLNVIQRAVLVGANPLELTSREFELLQYFAHNVGHVLTRRSIAEQVWKDDCESYSNVIDVHVSRLRNKLERLGATLSIQTVRGVGYVGRV
ncbi:MAG: response regulator transcription factor [Planctomycetota bacterium]